MGDIESTKDLILMKLILENAEIDYDEISNGDSTILSISNDLEIVFDEDDKLVSFASCGRQ